MQYFFPPVKLTKRENVLLHAQYIKHTLQAFTSSDNKVPYYGT